MTKILLVEDDKSLREIYAIRLQEEGYDIVTSGDGEEALAVAIKEKPDLVISDVMMPKISGFDMLDILRSTPETRDIRVIMMTALSSEDQRERGNALGADRYLVKSQVGIEDVVQTVHEVLADSDSSTADATAPADTDNSSPVVGETEPVTTPASPETVTNDLPSEQLAEGVESTTIEPVAPVAEPIPTSIPEQSTVGAETPAVPTPAEPMAVPSPNVEIETPTTVPEPALPNPEPTVAPTPPMAPIAPTPAPITPNPAMVKEVEEPTPVEPSLDSSVPPVISPLSEQPGVTMPEPIAPFSTSAPDVAPNVDTSTPAGDISSADQATAPAASSPEALSDLNKLMQQALASTPGDSASDVGPMGSDPNPVIQPVPDEAFTKKADTESTDSATTDNTPATDTPPTDSASAQ